MQHEEAVRKAASAGRLRLGTPDAWLTHCLTGASVHVTDPGQASCTGLYNLDLGVWSPEAASLFGIDVEMLPEIRATSEIVGETPRDLLGACVAVAARAGDQQAASFAHGIRVRGDAKLTLGTSAMLDVYSGNRVTNVAPGAFPLVLWRFEDGEDVHCVEGHVVTAGAIIEWLVALGLMSSSREIDDLAGGAETSEGVIFVPALQGLGTPYADSAARGFLGGLTRGTSAAHIARAALEGIAHRCVDLFDALGQGDATLRVDGGLAQSDLLLQALADLSGRPLARAAEIETTALGAAQLAGLAVGTFSNAEDCGEGIRAPTRFEPRITSAERSERRRLWRTAIERTRLGESESISGSAS
jgi:glycerol kinase